MNGAPPGLGIRRDVPLAPLTTLGIGGPARFFGQFANAVDAIGMLRWAADVGLAVHVLGGGSNVVVADDGIDGLVLQPANSEIALEPDADDVLVTAGAGVGWDLLVDRAVGDGLAGIECLSGIPGLCGAAPIQNIGAYGQSLDEVFEAATVLDAADLSIARWDAADCGFGYRDSAFKRALPGRFIVLDITLRLRPGGAPTLRYPDLQSRLAPGADLAAARAAVLAVRRSKGMVVAADDPQSRSAGSFFVNPAVSTAEADRIGEALNADAMPRWVVAGGEKLSAAWLIERCGMHKGYGDGRVGLSSKHTLALINRGGATAAELLAFAAHVADRVFERSGVRLQREPRLLGC